MVYDSGKMKRVFANATELGTYISDSNIGKKTIVSELRTIPGIIAVLMAVAVVASVFFQLFRFDGRIEVPDILGNALTTILGFYFGRQATGPQHHETRAGPSI